MALLFYREASGTDLKACSNASSDATNKELSKGVATYVSVVSLKFAQLD